MEIWKDIVGYEGLYQVSNMGNVKSLNYNRTGKERLLKLNTNTYGYNRISLSKNSITKDFKVHQLMAIVFLNHTPNGNTLVVDHINDIKTDNRLENLQVVTNRFNSRKTQGNYSSKYKGVCLKRKTNKWGACISIDGKLKHLGYFEKEYDAHVAYQNKLLSLSN